MAADQAGGMAVSGVPPGYAVPPIGGTILPGGTAPPMGGTVSCCLSAAWHDACFCRHDVMPSIDGTVSRRRIRRRKSGAGRSPGTASGGGRGDIPNGMSQRTPMDVLLGAADRRRPGMGGRFLRTPLGVLGFPPLGGFWRRERACEGTHAVGAVRPARGPGRHAQSGRGQCPTGPSRPAGCGGP